MEWWSNGVAECWDAKSKIQTGMGACVHLCPCPYLFCRSDVINNQRDMRFEIGKYDARCEIRAAGCALRRKTSRSTTIKPFVQFSISDSFHIKELRQFKHGGLDKGCP